MKIVQISMSQNGILRHVVLKGDSSFTIQVRNLKNGNYIIYICVGNKTKVFNC